MKYLVILLLVANPILAGSVRSIMADSKKMIPIYLTLGKSTVLHFEEKPTKIICGNQNYLNIEFTENDVTIQPLGSVHTNLFVYGKSHRYGFLINVGKKEKYDDLVKVKWGEITTNDRTSKGSSQAVAPSVTIANVAKCALVNTRYDAKRGLHILDIVFQNISRTPKKPNSEWFSIRDDSGPLKIAAIAFKSARRLRPAESIRARVILKHPETASFEIWIHMDGLSKKLAIQFDKSRR